MIRLAVILAAGMGTRLRETGHVAPKGFLRLGAETIIEQSVARLRLAGIERVLLVTGHQYALYNQLAHANPDVTTVHNPRYADSGSMYSLYCARGEIREPFLLLESDLIYEQRALSVLQNEPKTNVVLLSGTTHAGDEVYVSHRNGNVAGMSKDASHLSDAVAGELVGISKLSLPFFEQMVAFAETRFRDSLRLDYETDAMVAVAQSSPLYCSVVDDLLWSEIDDAAHLERANQTIYPAICARDSRTGS